MGNCNCSLNAITDAANVLDHIRVMTHSGDILELKGPKLVKQVLENFPGHDIFSQGHLSKPLFEDDQLVDGHVYYLLPKMSASGFGHFIKNTNVESPNVEQPDRVSSSIDVVTSGTGLEVVPGRRNGVWKVKLLISPKQLEEIFAEEVNTEALIEQMRLAANSAPKRTAKTSFWRLNFKPILVNMFKVYVGNQNKVQILEESCTNSPK